MSVLIALLIAIGIVAAVRAARSDGLISTHSYNNRYNDASGARDDRVG